MVFGQAVRSAYKRYVDFQGRSARSEYWWFYLFYILVIFGIVILMGIGGDSIIGKLFSLIYMVFALGSFLPAMGLSVRRLHDLEKSGWWVFISLVPILGAILLIVWFATKGTAGPNKFGDDPLGAPTAEVFS